MVLTPTNWIALFGIVLATVIPLGALIARVWRDQSDLSRRVTSLEESRSSSDDKFGKLLEAFHSFELTVTGTLARIETQLKSREKNQ